MTSNRSQHTKRRKSSLANTQSPYFISNGSLMKRSDDPNGKPLRIGRRVEIESLHLNIDTKEISYNLLFDFQNETHKITVPRKTLLSSSKVQDLLKFGVDVAGHKIHDVHKHLTYQEEQVPMSFFHSHVGFDQVQGRLVYKHEEAYGCNSFYVGDLNIKPKGSFDKWKALSKRKSWGIHRLNWRYS